MITCKRKPVYAANICILAHNYDLRFCSVGRLGHAMVHAMIEMHGHYVVDMRNREGFCAEQFLCLSVWQNEHE